MPRVLGVLALRRAFALFAAVGQTWRSASSDPRLFAAVWALSLAGYLWARAAYERR